MQYNLISLKLLNIGVMTADNSLHFRYHAPVTVVFGIIQCKNVYAHT